MATILVTIHSARPGVVTRWTRVEELSLRWIRQLNGRSIDNSRGGTAGIGGRPGGQERGQRSASDIISKGYKQAMFRTMQAGKALK